MSLDLPTLSIDGTPADYVLPWPDGKTLEPQSEGQTHITLSGLYELAPPADTEALSWSLSWDTLTATQRLVLEQAAILQAVSLRDPLGRPCVGQISDLRTSVKREAISKDGRLLYGASCQLHLLRVSHLPWCPDFKRPVRVDGAHSYYGRVGPRDALAEYGFIESDCPVSADGRSLVCSGGPLTNWGDLDSPSYNWDRTARDGAATGPIPTARLSSHHLSPRRGSFFFAFRT